MKNLYKKISLGILSVSLLIAGVSSQVLVVHANSDKLKSESDFIDMYNPEQYLSDSYIKRGAESFGYKIVNSMYYNKKSKRDVPYSINKPKFNRSFKDGYEFIEYIYANGMDVGIYNLYIAGIYYEIEVESPIKSKPPWQWWDDFLSVVWWED